MLFWFAVSFNLQGQDTDTIPQRRPLPFILKASNVKRSPVSKHLKTVSVKSPQATITSFGTEDGLALSSVYCGYRDRSGNLWFGTYGGGVNRYNGKSFDTFTTSHGLSHNMVISILEDRNGNFWFGTFGGGVSFYNGKSFKTYTVENGLAHNTVVKIFEDTKGVIWLGTFGGGVSRFDGVRFTNFLSASGLPHQKVWDFIEDSNGTLWAGTENGAARFHDNSFVIEKLTEGKIIKSLLQAKDGTIWFGTENQGVFQYAGSGLKHYTKDEGLSDNSVWDIIEDRHGRIWLGTEAGGASCWDGEKFSVINRSNGLSHNTVRSITEDQHGNIWFSTYGGGVCRYEGDLFQTFLTQQGLSNNKIRAVTQDRKGNLWIATLGGGACLYDGRSFTYFTAADGLASDLVRTIFEDSKGNIWLGTHGSGVSVYDGSFITNYSVEDGLGNNNVRCFFETSDGKIWIGTDGGASVFDGKSITTYTMDHGLPNDRVWNIIQDIRGDLWFGTFGGGVARYNGHSFKTFNTSDGLAHNSILSIEQDRDHNIWLGTVGGGVSRFDGHTFLTLNQADGMPDGTVYDILQDEQGMIWLGTNLGISRLSFVSQLKEEIPAGDVNVSNELLKTQFKAEWRNFNNKTGYPVKDVNTNAMFFTKRDLPFLSGDKGVLWIGCGDDKLIRFNEKAISLLPSRPSVRLIRVDVDNEQMSWRTVRGGPADSVSTAHQEIATFGHRLSSEVRDSLMIRFGDIMYDSLTPFFAIPQRLILPYHHNNISFAFSTVETFRYFMVNYQYRLQGQGDRWNSATKRSEVSFSNLWEGDYTFMVRAQNPEGVWGEPTSYSFIVLPPWYRTWWMYCIYIVCFIGAIRTSIKWREKNLFNEKLRLEQLVKARTEELVEQRDEAQQLRVYADEQRLLVQERSEEIQRQFELIEKDLSRQALQMIHQTNNLLELESEIRRMAAGLNPAEFQKLLRMISVKKSLDKEWESFNTYFSNVHKDFFERLKEHSSQLSIYEQRLCALLRLGLENREIATLLNIEASSVKMAKYRLKKKLGLDEMQDLFQFVSHL